MRCDNLRPHQEGNDSRLASHAVHAVYTLQRDAFSSLYGHAIKISQQSHEWSLSKRKKSHRPTSLTSDVNHPLARYPFLEKFPTSLHDEHSRELLSGSALSESSSGPGSAHSSTKWRNGIDMGPEPVSAFRRRTLSRSGEELPDWSHRQNAAPTLARLLLHRQSDADESSQGCRSEQWSLCCQSWLCVRQEAKP